MKPFAVIVDCKN